jgi:hypothetical protein
MYHTTRQRRTVVKTHKAVFEALETRQLLSVVSVSTNAQLATAISSATAGTEIDLAAGDYNGFQVYQKSGTASDPIIIKGTTGTVINGTAADYNGEIDITSCSYITLDDLDVEMNNNTSVRAGIWGGGSAGNNVNGVTIENCTVQHSDMWNILLGFTNNSLIKDNTLNGTIGQHDLYIGNSSNDDTIEGNLLENANDCGLEINEDGTQGGPGTGGGMIVEGNTIVGCGNSAGASINFDGVQNSIIENNLIYAGQRNGIAFYQINGNAPSTGNTIVNNTIYVNSEGPAGYAAISLIDGSADTKIYNNILSSAENTLSISADSQVGLQSDYNIFGSAAIDPTGNGDYTLTSFGGTAITLSAWQAKGYDQHSTEVDNLAGLFVNAASDNFQLASGSAAIGAASSSMAPLTDMLGNARPTSGSYDIGAYQYDGTPASSSGSSSSGSGSSGSSSSGSSSSGSSSTGSSTSGSSSSNSGSSSSNSGSSSSNSGSSSTNSGSSSSNSGSTSSGSTSNSSGASNSDTSGSSSSSSSSDSGSSASGSGSSSKSDSGSGSSGSTASATPPSSGPAAPSDLEAMAKWTGSVVLTWADTGTNVAQYAIERSGDGVTYDVIGTADSAQFMYADNTASAGTSYSYEVVAMDSAGNMSAASNSVAVTPYAAGDPTGEGKFCGQDLTNDSTSESASASESVRPFNVSSHSNNASTSTSTPAPTNTTPSASDANTYNGRQSKWWLFGRHRGHSHWKWA